VPGTGTCRARSVHPPKGWRKRDGDRARRLTSHVLAGTLSASLRTNRHAVGTASVRLSQHRNLIHPSKPAIVFKDPGTLLASRGAMERQLGEDQTAGPMLRAPCQGDRSDGAVEFHGPPRARYQRRTRSNGARYCSRASFCRTRPNRPRNSLTTITAAISNVAKSRPKAERRANALRPNGGSRRAGTTIS